MDIVRDKQDSDRPEVSAYIKKNFSEYTEDDKSTTLRASGGDNGVGSEVFVVYATRK